MSWGCVRLSGRWRVVFWEGGGGGGGCLHVWVVDGIGIGNRFLGGWMNGLDRKNGVGGEVSGKGKEGMGRNGKERMGRKGRVGRIAQEDRLGLGHLVYSGYGLDLC